MLGLLLGGVYACASLAQVVVGRLIDRFPLRPLQLTVVLCQVPMLLWAAQAQGRVQAGRSGGGSRPARARPSARRRRP